MVCVQALIEAAAFVARVFQRLNSMKTSPSKFISATLPVNKLKNRLVNILPCESP